MPQFPAFMQHPSNRIAPSAQSTPGVEGYVFDGADGSQMAFWTCPRAASSAPHLHDEYVLVLEGSYTLIFDGRRISLSSGQEYHIPRRVPHSGKVAAGTRTIHAFGGHRASRARE